MDDKYYGGQEKGGRSLTSTIVLGAKDAVDGKTAAPCRSSVVHQLNAAIEGAPVERGSPYLPHERCNGIENNEGNALGGNYIFQGL